MDLIRDYYDKRMICDTDGADGNVFFERKELKFVARSYENSNRNFAIRYEDIKEVRPYKGLKSTVVIVVNNYQHNFYMYKMNTFVQLVESGRKYCNEPEVFDATSEATEKKEPLTQADLDKLAQLGELHNKGILSDAQFEEEKNLILNRNK